MLPQTDIGKFEIFVCFLFVGNATIVCLTINRNNESVMHWMLNTVSFDIPPNEATKLVAELIPFVNTTDKGTFRNPGRSRRLMM